MKKLAFFALAFLFSVSIAGDLKSGSDFALVMLKTLAAPPTACPPSFVADQDLGYICGVGVTDVSALMSAFNVSAQIIAKELGYRFEAVRRFEYNSDLKGYFANYKLNDDVQAVVMLDKALPGQTLIAMVSRAGFGNQSLTAISTDFGATNQPPNSENIFRGTPGTAHDQNGLDLDCADFASQADAQSFFDRAGGVNADRHVLDWNNNGIPCEVNEVWSAVGMGGSGIGIAPPTAPSTPVSSPTSSTSPSSPAPSSSGWCWVNGYTRKDGTYVSGYWRRC